MAQPGMGGSLREEASGVSAKGAPARKLFGLVELDSAGTVLYTRFEPDGSPQFGGAPDYTGLNFYTEVAPFRNVVEFRNQLDSFDRGSQPSHSIDFICDYEDGPLPVRVLLARIRERSETDVAKSILVHIRKAQ
ncbi:MAG: hypothetical protein ABW208_27390 [Pyrinomonadaceae bacterium]